MLDDTLKKFEKLHNRFYKFICIVMFLFITYIADLAVQNYLAITDTHPILSIIVFIMIPIIFVFLCYSMLFTKFDFPFRSSSGGKKAKLPKLTPIILIIIFMSPVGITSAQEIIDVEPAVPCFLNYTAGFKLLENCNAKDDILGFVFSPFEYITGGFLSLIIASIFVITTWLKYHEASYTLLIGFMLFPLTIALIPVGIIGSLVTIVGVGIGILIIIAFRNARNK